MREEGGVLVLLDEETADEAAVEAYECGDGDGRGRGAEGDAADENDRFDAYEGDCVEKM
jgi:hypothetical protein